jgi:hypothetical protein
MKQLMTILAVLAGASSLASANLILYEPFDYDATGNPVLGDPATGAKAKGVWTSQGNGTQEVRINSGSLSYSGLPTSIGNSAILDNNGGNTGGGADASRLFLGGTNDSGTYYYSFVASIPSYTSNPAGFTESYFAGFDSNSTANPYNSGAGLFVKKDAVDASKIDLGIATTGSAGKMYTSSAYSPDNALFVVGSFTFGGPATLDVYADGATIPGTAPLVHGAVTSTSDTTLTSITNLFLRGNPGEPQGIKIDEIRIGTEWADVAAVPEPASIGLLSLGAIGLLARRRRKA